MVNSGFGEERNSGFLAGAERRIKLTELFLSLQGESLSSGSPTVFIRFTGCPLRCSYCDTAYAFDGGAYRDQSDIVAETLDYGVRHVTVTGGEPLAQKEPCLSLLTKLCNEGLIVSLETGGEREVSAVDHRVIKVMDYKTPGSGEEHRNRYENIAFLNPQDQIKFVICDRRDYEWTKALIKTRNLQQVCHLLLSPSYGQLSPKILAEWVLEDRLPVQMQIQLHKLLWGEEPGR